MSTETSSSVIHRKAHLAREDFNARAMSPSKAMRLALENAGDALFDLPLTVRAVEQRALVHAALREEVGEHDLAVLLDGAGGMRGAALFDTQIVQAMVEVQTMGLVREGEAEPRPYSQTDAAMMAPLIDTVMDRFDIRLSEGGRQGPPLHFRFGDRVEDARALLLAVEAPDFDLFRLTVDIGRGAKTGALTVLLPQAALKKPDPAQPSPGEPGEGFDLSRQAMHAPVHLNVVLQRLHLSLGQVCALRPGMVLPLDMSAISRAELVAATGHVAARAQLGQVNGLRALRLGGPDTSGNPGAPRDGGKRPRAAEDAQIVEGALAHGLPDAASDPAVGALDSLSDAGAMGSLGGLGDPGNLSDLVDMPAGETPPDPVGIGGEELENIGQDPMALPGGLPDLPDMPGLPDLPGEGAEEEEEVLPGLPDI